jgi:type IV pilus assembly protein PilY1
MGKSPSSYLPAQYTGNYLNWYFGSAPINWGTAARRKPGTAPRLDIAKDAAKTLVASLSAVRVGLATYDGNTGAHIRVGVDDLTSTQLAALDNTIDALTPSGSTPLAGVTA